MRQGFNELEASLSYRVSLISEKRKNEREGKRKNEKGERDGGKIGCLRLCTVNYRATIPVLTVRLQLLEVDFPKLYHLTPSSSFLIKGMGLGAGTGQTVPYREACRAAVASPYDSCTQLFT